MTAQAKREETRRATYQDVLDAPPHKVAEVISGTLHTYPRQPLRHARASPGIGAKIARRSISVMAAPAAGGAYSNLNFTWVKTSWCRTSPAGGARR